MPLGVAPGTVAAMVVTLEESWVNDNSLVAPSPPREGNCRPTRQEKLKYLKSLGGGKGTQAHRQLVVHPSQGGGCWPGGTVPKSG